jgi:hypothetical protein
MENTMYRSAVCHPLLALLLLVTPLAAQQPPQGRRTNGLPASVILLPSGKTLVLPTANGGGEAVDVVSGKAKWTVSGVTHFLGVNQDRLLVLKLAGDSKEKVQVVALNPMTGKSESATSEFTFQAQMVALSVQPKDFPLPPTSTTWKPTSAGGYTFTVQPHLLKDELFLVWQASDAAVGGAPRPTFGGNGTMRVDLETGKASALAKGERVPKDAKGLNRGAGVQPAGGMQFQVTVRPGPKAPGAIITQTYLLALRDGQVQWEKPLGGPNVLSLAP